MFRSAIYGDNRIQFVYQARNVAQSVERWTLDLEIQGSKPALGTGGKVGSHPTNPIPRDARSLDDQDLPN